MWVPELLDCVLSLEDWRGATGTGKKMKKPRERLESSEGTGRPRGEFCMQGTCAELALCWGGWQCPAVLQVPCPVGGAWEGARAHPGVVPMLLKSVLADNLSWVQGAAATSSRNVSALSLMAANWQSPAKWGYHFLSSDSPGNTCVLSYLENMPSSRRNCNSFLRRYVWIAGVGGFINGLIFLKAFLNFVNLCL